jgi:hypothetical protein
VLAVRTQAKAAPQTDRQTDKRRPHQRRQPAVLRPLTSDPGQRLCDGRLQRVNACGARPQRRRLAHPLRQQLRNHLSAESGQSVLARSALRLWRLGKQGRPANRNRGQRAGRERQLCTQLGQGRASGSRAAPWHRRRSAAAAARL